MKMYAKMAPKIEKMKAILVESPVDKDMIRIGHREYEILKARDIRYLSRNSQFLKFSSFLILEVQKVSSTRRLSLFIKECRLAIPWPPLRYGHGMASLASLVPILVEELDRFS